MQGAASCSCFLEREPRQRFEPRGSPLFSSLAADWMQHYPQFQFLIFDSGDVLSATSSGNGPVFEASGVIKRLARKLADDDPELALTSSVSLACSAHNNGFKTSGYSPVQWTFGADNENHGFSTSMPIEIETYRMAAMSRYLQEQARDTISRAQHVETIDLSPGRSVMYLRRGKVTRGVVGAPSKSRLWARVIMTEPVQQWSGSVRETMGQVGVVWISHGNKLIKSHPTQLRRCSEREVAIANFERPHSCLFVNERGRFDECLLSWTPRRCVLQSATS